MSMPAAVPRFAEAAVSRARLSLVAPTRSEAPLAPFVALLFVLLGGGVAGLLMFNTSMQQDSFTQTRLQAQATALQAQEQGLQMDLQNLRDPQNLALRAKRLGMVPPASPAFLLLGSNTVTGTPAPATASTAFRINPLPPVKPKVLAPAPRVVRAKSGGVPSGSDQPVRSTTTSHANGR